MKEFESLQEWDMVIPKAVQSKFNDIGIYSISPTSIGKGLFSITYMGTNLKGEGVAIKSTNGDNTKENYLKDADDKIIVSRFTYGDSADDDTLMLWEDIEKFQVEQLQKSERAAELCNDPNLVARETFVGSDDQGVRYSYAPLIEEYTRDESRHRLDFIQLIDRLSNAPVDKRYAVIGGDLHTGNIGIINNHVCVLDYDSLRTVDLSSTRIPIRTSIKSTAIDGTPIYDFGTMDIEYDTDDAANNIVVIPLLSIIDELGGDLDSPAEVEFINSIKMEMNSYDTDSIADRRLKVFIIHTMLGDDNFGGELGTWVRNYLYTDKIYFEKITQTKMYDDASRKTRKVIRKLWKHLHKLTSGLPRA